MTVQEGEDRDSGPTQAEKTFWNEMMDRFGSEKKYNKQLINAFKHGDSPEIIIVVDKLLTEGRKWFEAAGQTIGTLSMGLD